MMTSTGPFALSGAAAGVSVDGPMASVSARLRLVGGAGFASVAEVGSVLPEGLISVMFGFSDMTWVVTGTSET